MRSGTGSASLMTSNPLSGKVPRRGKGTGSGGLRPVPVPSPRLSPRAPPETGDRHLEDAEPETGDRHLEDSEPVPRFGLRTRIPDSLYLIRPQEPERVRQSLA